MVSKISNQNSIHFVDQKYLTFVYSFSKFGNVLVIFDFPDRRLPENPFESREC